MNDGRTEKMWCYHGNETSLAVLSHGSICFVRSSDFWACGSGGSRVGPWGPELPPYFSTKMMPEGLKKHLWRLAPPYLRIWMTAPPPLSEGEDPPLTVDETSPAALLHSSRFVCSSKSWACGWNSIVWPFKWNLAFSCTFTRCYLFSMWL